MSAPSKEALEAAEAAVQAYWHKGKGLEEICALAIDKAVAEEREATKRICNEEIERCLALGMQADEDNDEETSSIWASREMEARVLLMKLMPPARGETK